MVDEKIGGKTATSFGRVVATENGKISEDDEDDRSLITPQWIINSLPHYTIRNGAYTTIDNFCGICYSKYNVGDRAICLPCHHTFHYYCIENWLKYVKPACPIDKKSVIRSQYWQNMVDERKHYLSEASALNDTNEVFLQINNSEDRESSNSSDPENIILDDPICHKIWTKERECGEILAQKPGLQEPMPEVPVTGPQMQEPKPPLEISPKMISLVESLLDYEPGASSHNNSEKLETPRDKKGIRRDCQDLRITFPDSQQLRESVKEIRRSLGINIHSRRKLENPAEYQETLDKVSAKLSECKIQSRKLTAKGHSENCDQKVILRNKSPVKSAVIRESLSQHAVLDKRNVTFGDLLNLEKEQNSVKKCATLPKDVPIKYDRLLRKNRKLL